MVRVAVIGAGASGLPSIKSCIEEGIEPVCFEKTDNIGGLWHFRERVSHPDIACVFKSTVMNTSKEFMSYSDFPCPKEFPNFMHNTKVFQYLKLYAEKFDLMKYIRFNTSVEWIQKAEDHDVTGRWNLFIKDEKTGDAHTEVFDAVMVCTGHHATPNVPDFEGLQKFEGTKVHTHDYKVPTEYVDKRVVIIGIGNSGCDAAVELGRVSSQVYLSTRTGAWILHRLWRGLPFDMSITRFGSIIPFSISKKIAERQLESLLDHELYGLKPKYSILEMGATLNDDLPNSISNGSVVIKPDVRHFERDAVVFEDDTRENIDAVVLATGYRINFPMVPESVLKPENNFVTLYKYVFPPDLKHPTIAFIGLVQPRGAVQPFSELQARWATRVFKKSCQLPSKSVMMSHIAQRRDEMAKRYVKSPRHTIQVDLIPYADQLAEEFGVKPDPWKILFQDPVLFWRYIFGPFLSYQYRLQGPGTWDGAPEAIKTVWQRIEAPYKTRKCAKRERSVGFVCKAFLFILLAVVLASALMA